MHALARPAGRRATGARELYGITAAEGARGGFVVTSGDFTEEVVRFANSLDLTLMNGKTRLLGLRRGDGAAPGAQRRECWQAVTGLQPLRAVLLWKI